MPIPSAKNNQAVSFLVIIFIVKMILTSDAFKSRSAIVSSSAPVREQEPVFRAIVPSIISVNSATVYIIKNKTDDIINEKILQTEFRKFVEIK